VDYYNIFLYGFFLFFMIFFSNWSLSNFFFLYWAGWEFSFVVFSKITLWIATMFPPYDFCFAAVFLHMFFLKNYLCRIYFFNIKLVESWALAFPIYFYFKIVFFYFCFISFFFIFFFRIVFVDFIFLILNWLTI